MNYYPFHLGDYAAHTAHLEPMEDLAYRRMLDVYYLREGPLPNEAAECARLVRMRANVAEIEAVLTEFFTLTGEGWRHFRCDEEIERMQDKQAKARASAAASVNARKAKAQPPLHERQAGAERTLNDRSTDVELPTPTPTPTPTPKEETKDKASRSSAREAEFEPPDWVDSQAWADYAAMRVKIKKPMTPAAKRLAVSKLAELRDEGHDPSDVLCQSTFNSWQGLFRPRSDENPKGRAPQGAHHGFDNRNYRAGVNPDGSLE